MREGLSFNKAFYISLVLILAGASGFFLWHKDELSVPRISYQQTPELGEAVVVSFPFDLSERQALKSFSISPSVTGELQWVGEYRELHFVPTDGFDPDTSYTITIKRPFSFLALVDSNIAKRSFQPEGFPTKFSTRVSGRNLIYYITETGLKRPITLEIFYSYPDNKEEDIKIINEKRLSFYPDNLLIGLENDPKIYLLENGAKRLIENPEAFNALGLDWETISPVNQTEFNSYSEADPIRFDSLPYQKTAKGKFIEVDLETMKLSMWEDGLLAEQVPVAGTGNPKTAPTRKGFFTVLSKENKHLSSLSRVWMPWSIRYSGNYYLHGWPYWPNGARLTSQYSSGCVRLQDADAKKVYDFAEVGIPVLVH